MQKEELESYIFKIENAMFWIDKIMSAVAKMRKDFTVASIDAEFIDAAHFKLSDSVRNLEEVKKMRLWERAEWRS